MKLMRVAWVCLLAVWLGPAMLGSAPAARAQEAERITMLVNAGFAAFAKDGAWTPVRVELVNQGDAFDGEVQIVNTRTTVTERYVQRVSLGRNASRKVTLYIPGNSNSYVVKLMQGSREIASADPVLRQLTSIDRLVAVVSDPPDALNFLGDVRVPFGGSTTVAQVTLEDLPNHSAGFDAIDVLMFGAVDTASLSVQQRAAIRAWVLAGGHLILAGGPGARLSTGGFTDIAPARSDSALINTSVERLIDLIAPNSVERPFAVPTQTVPAISLSTYASGAQSLVSSSETPLIMRRRLARGIVDQLAFDPSLAPLRDWPGNAQLFEALLGGRVNMPNSLGTINDVAAATQTVGALPAASLPSPLIVFAFFGLYVLVVGPLNFYVLRRLRRTNLAWITVPLLVTTFTLAGVLTGFRLRGSTVQLHRLSMLIGDTASSDARAYVLLGAYSPRTVQTDLSTGRALVTSLAPPREADAPVTEARIEAGEPVRVTGMQLDGATLQGYNASGDVETGRLIQAEVVYAPKTGNAPARIEATVTNRSEETLRACTLMAGSDYHAIGDIAPGQTAKQFVSLVVNHPQTGLNLHGAELLQAIYYRGRYYGISSRANPESAAPSTTSDFPFDLNGAPSVFALVNWRTFERNTLDEEATRGLVASLMGLEYSGNGVQLGCWASSAGLAATVDNGAYTDHTLHVWRLPVQSFLVNVEQTLPPELFTWDIADTSASVSLESGGAVLQPGDHIFSLSPWLDTRMTQTNVTVLLDLQNSLTELAPPEQRTGVDLYDWQARQFVELAESLDMLDKDAGVQGAFISASGEMRVRLRVRNEQITISRIAPTVRVP